MLMHDLREVPQVPVLQRGPALIAELLDGVQMVDHATVAAARALAEATPLPAREICERALRIAGEICIYTNQQLAFEEI